MPQKGEQRHLTVMFSDLSASTQLGELMHPQDYSDLMQSLRRIFRDVVVRHRGRIARVQGDGLLAVFGISNTNETDTKSAIHAALEIHRQVKDLPAPVKAWEMTMHSGIHGGAVQINEGDLETGRFDILGSVPNIAAKLASAAQADAILVSESALGPLQSTFGSHEILFVELAGSSPLAARYVLDPREKTQLTASYTSRFQAPFAGREQLLRQMLNAVRRSSLSSKRHVEIVGPSGMGKTRLLEEFSHRAENSGMLVLRGYCDELTSPAPLQPFVQIARHLFQIKHGDETPRILEKISTRFASLNRETDAQRKELCDAANSFLAGSSAPASQKISPREILEACVENQRNSQVMIVFLLDDWQWADEASQRLLEEIARANANYTIITAMRPASKLYFGDDDIERLHLEPLDNSYISAIVTHYLPGAGPFIEQEIASHAQGIPLYAEEMCKSAIANKTGFLKTDWKTPSGWINHQLIARFSSLTPSELVVLKTAAVFGSHISSMALSRLTGHLSDKKTLNRLQASGHFILSEDGATVSFKHSVVREAAYSIVERHERVAIHLKIAALVSAGLLDSGLPDTDELLAFHYTAGGIPELAAVYAEKAATNAAQLFALDRVRKLTLDAIVSIENLPELSLASRQKICELVNKLGMACVFDPIALGDGLAVFERGLGHAKQTGEQALIARCGYWLGYVSYARGQQALALKASSEALNITLQIGDTKLATQIRATIGQIYLAVHSYNQALPLIESAIDAKRAVARPGGSVAVGSSYALACKGGLLADRGDFDEAQKCFDEALALLGDTMHQVGSSVRNWIGLAYLWQGRDEEAFEMGKESMRIARNARSTQLLAMSSSLEAYAGWRVYKDPSYVERLKEVMSWVEGRNDTLLSSMIYGWLVDACADLGQIDQARHYAARLLRRARQQDRTGEALGYRALARLSHRPALKQRYLRWAQRSAAIRQSKHEEEKNLKLLAVF